MPPLPSQLTKYEREKSREYNLCTRAEASLQKMKEKKTFHSSVRRDHPLNLFLCNDRSGPLPFIYLGLIFLPFFCSQESLEGGGENGRVTKRREDVFFFSVHKSSMLRIFAKYGAQLFIWALNR